MAQMLLQTETILYSQEMLRMRQAQASAKRGELKKLLPNCRRRPATSLLRRIARQSSTCGALRNFPIARATKIITIK